MNKTTRNILYGAILIIIIGLIVYPKLPKSETSSTEDSSASSPKLTVEAIVVKNEKLENKVKMTGSILADESVVLNTEVAGKIAQIMFREGQQVKKGDILLKLNDEEIKAEIQKLEFTKKLNEDNEFRQRQLLDKEAISREEYETALTTLNTTNAELKVFKTRLDKHYLRAPFDGEIGLRDISEGGYLNPGARVADLYKVNPVKLDFAVPSKYISMVDVGDKIQFQVDAYDQLFEGEIYAIEPQIDPETRSIRVRAKANNDEKLLFPGQFARIELILETIPEALMIPTEAVIPEMSGKKCYVFKNGKAENQPITTDIRTENRLQVTTGLQAGDTVITTGILQIKPGTELNAIVQ